MEEKDLEKIIKDATEQENVPESLRPENMRKFLEENAGKKQKKHFRAWYSMAAAAACLVLVVFVGKNIGTMPNDSKSEAEEEFAQIQEDTSYDELYDFFRKREKEYTVYSSMKGDMIMEDAVEESATADQQNGEGNREYADTNKQEERVDEADIIKNDGRYLYQIVTNEDYSRSVQIADTQGGLKEITHIDGFDNIFELYVWKDSLVIMESCWAEDTVDEDADRGEFSVRDVAYGTAFQKVYIYDITDRAKPKQEHVFTMKGRYLDSRITDGYLYCFLNCGVDKLQGRKYYEDYVPVLEGKAMSASSIYFPEEADSSSYLVMATVDLDNPEKFKDTKAVVSAADRVYVTDSDIYVLDNVYDCETDEDGVYSNKTSIIRFYYENGILHKDAEGSVKGILLDDMAINEYDGYLRMVVTVNSYKRERVIDDIFEDFLGYETIDSTQDNSLYVLDKNLEIVGKIEGLAEDEQIYSARFMGDTGYFVTFRQTDPLFSVDLSEPKNPEILGELKISGFSEYLHFYNENLLLGIGMEADEETGRTEGMKISMFDISNPADVNEQDKYALSEYDYSEGLYNYKAVMIDTKKNLFGFYAEGWRGEEEKADYLLFSYENGGFLQKMKISCNRNADGIYADVRGTYIGDVFYLMYGDGRIEAYSLEDGSLLEQIYE